MTGWGKYGELGSIEKASWEVVGEVEHRIGEWSIQNSWKGVTDGGRKNKPTFQIERTKPRGQMGVSMSTAVCLLVAWARLLPTEESRRLGPQETRMPRRFSSRDSLPGPVEISRSREVGLPLGKMVQVTESGPSAITLHPSDAQRIPVHSLPAAPSERALAPHPTPKPRNTGCGSKSTLFVLLRNCASHPASPREPQLWLAPESATVRGDE